MNLLAELASPENTYSPLIRTLYIDSLSPSDSEEKRLRVMLKLPAPVTRYCVSDPRLREDTQDHEAEELKTLLKPALESLRNLEAIR
jgi:hypothetical protein